MSRTQTRPFDMANHLASEEEIAEYLRQVLEDGDPAELAGALGDIARARGMTQLARDTGLSRESLYKSLSGERAPNSDTLFKVLHAMGSPITTRTAIATGARNHSWRGGKLTYSSPPEPAAAAIRSADAHIGGRPAPACRASE